MTKRAQDAATVTYIGPCVADQACRAYNPTTGPEDTDQHALGPACLRAGEHATRSLPADWRDLEQLLPRPIGVWGDGQPHGHPGPPTPINLAVEALQRAIWWTATAWEEVARDMHHLSDPPLRVREGPALVRACHILAPRLGALSDLGEHTMQDYPCADDDEAHRHGVITYTMRTGAQAVHDLIRLHQRAVSMLGLTAPVRRLPGWCVHCGREELRQDQPRWVGDEQLVYCHWCAAVSTYGEYQRQMGAWAA